MRFSIEVKNVLGHLAWLGINTYILTPQKDGTKTCSGEWSFAEVPPTFYLGNQGIGGKFYSKIMRSRPCASPEEAWADRCDTAKVANQYVFFFDNVQNRPFLILKEFNTLTPRGGTGMMQTALGTHISDPTAVLTGDVEDLIGPAVSLGKEVVWLADTGDDNVRSTYYPPSAYIRDPWK